MTPHKTRTEEKYETWRAEVYDKYNSIKKTDLIRAIDNLKSITKPKKYSRVNDCRRNVESESIWSKQGYILRHIRLAVLRHDWNSLRKLILRLCSNENFYCYVKEMTFLLGLMAGGLDERMLEELKLCFSTAGRVEDGKSNPYDIWYIEDV